MSLNISKCYSMSFYRSRSPLQFVYSINNISLESVSHIKDLGITFSFNLNFRQHLENIISKALKILGFVKRHSFDFKNPHSLQLLYNALVRSILEYGSIIWSPYTKSDINSIERVQNRFLKYMSFKLNIPIIDHNYNPIRSTLNVQTLLLRRELSDITFVYNLINGLISSPPLLNSIPFNVPFHRNRFIPFFYVPSYSTNYLTNSPIPRALSLRNKCPTNDFFHSPLSKILLSYCTLNMHDY